MTTIDDLLEVGDRRRDQTRASLKAVGGYVRVGLWSVGWLLAKVVSLVLATIAGVFFVLGWICARIVPVLKWMRTAFVLGWEAGRASGGARVSS